MSDSTQRHWTALLMGGVSGAGKTMVARRLGLEFGVPWLQVDDLRLALQHSEAALPDAADTAALRLFWDTPAVWQQPPELSPRPWPTLAARIVTAVAGN